MQEQFRERITLDPGICGGKPCICGTRIPIAVVLDALAEGLSPEQVVDHYPSLTVEDIRAAVAYRSS